MDHIYVADVTYQLILADSRQLLQRSAVTRDDTRYQLHMRQLHLVSFLKMDLEVNVVAHSQNAKCLMN